MRCLLPILLAYALQWAAPSVGDTGGLVDSTWIDVNPLRLEAITEGRTFTYNTEAFLQRFSVRGLSSDPRPGEDGLWGTGGSVTGDELYLDINGQYTLRPDDGRYGIIARLQRREDFDGRFDRQLLGVSRQFAGNWEGALLADITGDKGRVDFQMEATWRPSDERFLRLAIAQPDRLYDDKSASDNRYGETPTTLFAHYRQPLGDGGHAEAAINVTPSAEFTDAANGYTIDADQVRFMGDVNLPVTRHWYAGARLELERSTRDFSALPGGERPGGNFERDMQHLILSVSAPNLPLSPRAGVRHFELDEQGFFGTGLATDGFNERRETGVFAGITLRTGETHWLEPTVFAQRVDIERDFPQRPRDSIIRERWIGKVNLPWRWIISRESGAILTVNPSFRLHRLAFGGGNIQLHWPL